MIYTSVAVREMRSEDLDDILAVSLSRNAAMNITGLLVHYTETSEFMQLLEGARDDVLALFHGSIAKDPRHRSVEIFHLEDGAERLCPDWRMSFCLERHGGLKERTGLSGFVRHGELSDMRAGFARRLMIAYREEIMRRDTV
ncbi:BLUF domain-containing protein [Breoghania corrubedonensis]|uniref:BLUF domain-containing protein n=1 Tax=Breoghania corrubedonensis TaxID=665038 RepID=UPI0014734596|nr:BLUF domain-containing protein [Breoghania corrubedonensis]